jgi:5-formyltetrahydrofolate cyclo-ligase
VRWQQRDLARALRAALSPAQRRRCARGISRFIERSGWLQSGLRVALYASFGDEVGTGFLRQRLCRRACQLYWPRIINYPDRRLVFVPDSGGAWRPNRYGIPEPPAATPVKPSTLDLIVIPTLAFNRVGVRLGYGAGYYDRALAAARPAGSRRPLLVGLAYAINEQPSIQAAAHDIELDFVVTETGIHDCRGRVA